MLFSVGPRPFTPPPAPMEHLCAAAEFSLIKLTFSHDTSPHCTRFSRLLKTERRESAVRCCCPGDISSTTAPYASSTAGDPDAETNEPQQARTSSAELRMSECWRDETWIGFRGKSRAESQVEAETVSGFFCTSIELQSSARRLNPRQCT